MSIWWFSPKKLCIHLQNVVRSLKKVTSFFFFFFQEKFCQQMQSFSVEGKASAREAKSIEILMFFPPMSYFIQHHHSSKQM